ncbi:hypothetical protein L6164_015970 [Bauhinia variegata]|uniref:Uncharacterized protein n=1 Tax=Bauhinia variegata TaxID=167791 RepID=A0ACB9NM70_BAUVA|nr:hypothetical protein L6164_015970 [Bauhinia variegata]
MASLPSVTVGGTPKLDPEFRKQPPNSFLTEKSPSISFQKSYGVTHLDGSLDSRNLDFREALSLIQQGTNVETSFYIPLLQECIDKNSLSEAQIVHGHIIKTGTHEDVFVMTFLVNVYAKCGNMESSRKVFDKMPRRNVVTWIKLMAGYIQNSRPEHAIHVFQKMLDEGVYPSSYTLAVALSACSSLHSVKLGDQFYAYIIKYHIDSDTSIGNALCSLYSKCGRLESALKAFRRIKEKNVISWTAAISACGDNGEAITGLRLFIEMLSEDIEPNELTLTSVLSLCCGILSLEIGTQVHSLSIKLGYESNLRIRNSLVYLYLKCGRINEADIMFDRMDDTSLVTWNAMIAGHAQMMEIARDNLSAYQSGIEALNLFLKLNGSGMKPDLFTFSSVFRVCCGLVALEQGEQIHAQTIKTGVRRIMEEENSGKLKDWSWISIKDKVYSFEPNDKAHPQSSLLYSSLENLLAKAKTVGYESLEVESMEMGDEEDEGRTPSSTIFESENLVVALGLENLPNSSPIRVIKNTIMSRDSHNFIKYISTLTDREVIIRDSKRLHKFVNGQCLCGDFGVFI